MVMQRGFEIAEVVYPYDDRSRYRRDQPIPWILGSALARLSDEPDALLDETLAFAAALPRQGLADHYRCVFDWLAQRSQRAFWIEKSGSSIEYLDALHAFYPGAPLSAPPPRRPRGGALDARAPRLSPVGLAVVRRSGGRHCRARRRRRAAACGRSDRGDVAARSRRWISSVATGAS